MTSPTYVVTWYDGRTKRYSRMTCATERALHGTFALLARKHDDGEHLFWANSTIDGAECEMVSHIPPAMRYAARCGVSLADMIALDITLS